MKNGDRKTIEEIGISSSILMERAALESVAFLEAHCDLTSTLLVCGAGNNGGDGLAIARLLYLKKRAVTVFFVGHETQCSSETKLQLKILSAYNIPIIKSIDLKINGKYSTIVDCIFGVGLSRPIIGVLASLIKELNKMQGKKVSIDVPSGICADTGQVLGCAFRADYTISIAYDKLGTQLYPGKDYAGTTKVVDIGIESCVFNNEHVCITYNRQDASALLPARKADSHKGTYGKLLIIAGSMGMSGAAYFCARAAYAVGAGIVQIYTPDVNREILQQQLPEAIVTTYSVDNFDDTNLLKLLAWADYIVIGPGIGQSIIARKIIHTVITWDKCGLLIDADGLNILSNELELLEDHKNSIIITPHMKEMSRLLKKSVETVQSQSRSLTACFCKRYHVTCILKNSRSFVIDTMHPDYLNITGNSAMAKAGSGDVLAGIIAGLLVQGVSDYYGATLGVYLHGLAGDYAQEALGSYSVLASDLIQHISKALKGLEEVKDSENIHKSICKN